VLMCHFVYAVFSQIELRPGEVMVGNATAAHQPDSMRTGSTRAAVQMLHNELAKHAEVTVTRPQGSVSKVNLRTLLLVSSTGHMNTTLLAHCGSQHKDFPTGNACGNS